MAETRPKVCWRRARCRSHAPDAILQRIWSQQLTVGCHTSMKAQPVEQDDCARPVPVASDFELFDTMYLELRRFAAVVADLDIDPDDLVQDAITRTLERHALSDLDNPQAYLRRAIVNHMSNQRRRAGRLRKLLPRLGNDTVVTDHYPSDLALLDELEPVDRAVLFLADVEGLAHEVIATHVGLSPTATRKRASRARAHIRNLLTDEGMEL